MTTPAFVRAAVRRSWIGRTLRPAAVRVLTGVFVGIAVAGTVLDALLSTGRTVAPAMPPLAGIMVATVLAAAAQLARLNWRIGRDTVPVAWGEAAFIFGFAAAPTGWLPLATLIGVTAAEALRIWLGGQRDLAAVAQQVALLTLASSVATSLSAQIAGDAALLDLRTQMAVLAGAATYLVVTSGLAALTLVLRHAAEPGDILIRVAHAKIPLFLASLVVGIAATFALHHQPLWLVAVAPGLWLLQRSYRLYLRTEEDRQRWQSFAAATTALPGGTVSDVISSGLRGALEVFGARRVGIEFRVGDNLDRYAAHGRVDTTGPETTADQESLQLLGRAITRTMVVRGEELGELSVWLGEPRVTARDEAAVSAYGDALGAALHDAMTRERLTEVEERIAYSSVHDRLTGLLNRTTLMSEGDRLARRAERGRHVALLLLDINDFREVNGTLGHRFGDDVLRLVGRRLTELAGDGEVVARTGDDEFALLVPHVYPLTDAVTAPDATGGLPQALRRAREVVERLAQPMEVGGVRLAVEVAVGVATTPAGRADLVELIRRASLALDQAKARQVAVAAYEPAQDAVTTDGLALLAELHDALAVDDQLLLLLQPEVDLGTAAPTGVEALIRWRHPRRGQLSPDAFIATVEQTELLAPFTRRVLDLALGAAASWITAGIDVPVSVNISARSLLDPELPGQVVDALRRHRVPASRLVLEITESVAVSEQDIVDDVLAELREAGIQLSLDDFGTGYSSLSIVTRVPVDEIKIDRSFVDDMIDVAAAEAVVRSAVELGARLGVRVVAEGVETTEQRAALIGLNCPTAQGYHFCKPMPADRIVAALTQLSEAAPARILKLRADDAS